MDYESDHDLPHGQKNIEDNNSEVIEGFIYTPR